MKMNIADPSIASNRSFRQLRFVFLTSNLVIAAFLFAIMSSHNWDPKTFIMQRSPNVPLEQTWGIGYDGQYSYAIALHPWGSTEDIDQPGFRYQRIFYPLLTKVISFGNANLIPWIMLAINFSASIITCNALAVLLSRRRSSPLLALVLILFIGFLLSVRMNLSEPLAIGLALAGWLSYENKKIQPALVLFALSGLTKEVGLTFPAALIVWEILRKNSRRAGWIFLGSFTPYIAWYVFLYFHFGVSEDQISKSSLLLIPFWGFRYLEEPASRILVAIWVVVPAIASGGVAFLDLYRDAPSFGKSKDTLLVLSQVALISVLPILTWEDPLAVFRFGIGMVAAVLIWLASRHPRFLPYVVGLWAPSGLILLLISGLVI